MNHSVLFLSLIALLICGKLNSQTIEPENQAVASITGKVKVLNIGTFHMGATSDASGVEFDENDEKNQQDAQAIAKLIAEFKPTIICVEVPKEQEGKLNAAYQDYLRNPKMASTYSGEIGLVAFEVARMCNVERLQGIDHEMNYNYGIGYEITNAIDSTTLMNYYANPFRSTPELLNIDPAKLSLLEKLQITNSSAYLDFLITLNADILTFAGTENGYEGADEAAKYYQRNLRIYSNLNRIQCTKEDRIFILFGASHTGFLKGFLERSPKYEMVKTADYLK